MTTVGMEGAHPQSVRRVIYEIINKPVQGLKKKKMVSACAYSGTYGHAMGIRPRGASYSPARSHNRHICRRLAVPPYRRVFWFALRRVDKLCFPFQL